MCVLPKAIVRIFPFTAAFAALVLVSAGERAFADSGCLSSASSLHQTEIDAFLERPADLLDLYPAGGPAMSARVQRLAGSDTSTVPALIALAKGARPAHVVALSMGLGRAAAHCAAKRPDLAHTIKQRVAAEGSSSLRALFSSEATVMELALGAPDGAGTAATSSIDRVADMRTGPPSSETLGAIIKTRVPRFLLPSYFGVLPGPPPEAPAASPKQSGDRASAPDGSGSSTPPDAGTAAALSALNESASFFALVGGGGGPGTLGGGEGLRTPSAAESSSGGSDSTRWSSGGGYKGGPYFGTGGVAHSAQEVVSPTR